MKKCLSPKCEAQIKDKDRHCGYCLKRHWNHIARSDQNLKKAQFIIDNGCEPSDYHVRLLSAKERLSIWK